MKGTVGRPLSVAVIVLLCFVFWSGREVLAADASCSREATTRSQVAVGPTNYTIVNRTATALTVHWLDYDGRRRRWYEVAPGGTHTHRGAYSTHPFVAADPAGNCIRLFNPPGEIIISEADLQTGGRATTESLQDLQRKRIEERESAERRRETRQDAEERVRSWFMSVGSDVVARFMSQSGLQFEEIDDRQFDNYRLLLGVSRETRARDWGRCGSGKARILVVGDNPFATKCNGHFFVPKEGEPVYVFMIATADDAARMCHATIRSSRFISQGVWHKNEALTYAFPCGENVFESKRAEIERLVEQATLSALSKR